jgi:hypothetical protein
MHMGLCFGQVTLESNQFFRQFAEALTSLNVALKSPEDLTVLVHNTALFINDFQVFGQMASKLGGAYKKPREYLLNSVEAFFLQ